MRSLTYSLKEGGTLMLGKSEDPGQSRKRFTSVFPGLSIYLRNPGSRRKITEEVLSGPATTQTLQNQNQELAQIATRALARRFSPPAVLINERNEILYVQGSTGDFLELPAGQSTNELLSMARPEVRPALIRTLNSARSLNLEVSHTEKTSVGTLQIIATPLEGESQPLVLVTFLVLDLGKKAAPEAVPDPDSREEQGNMGYH